MTQRYDYFKYDPANAIPSGKARGENWHEECFQAHISAQNKDCEIRTVVDPATGEQSTKMVQVNNGKVVSIRCARGIDHPTKDERVYLTEDTSSSEALFSLNDPSYRTAAKKTEYTFEEKTKTELEDVSIGFIFDEE